MTRKWPAEAERYLSERFALTLNEKDVPLTQIALRDAMRQHDAICPTVTDSIGTEVLATPDRRVRIVANFGVGVNHIDLQAARAAGIVVTNTPDVLTDSTADLAILLMLMTSRRAGEGERELRSGSWTGWRPTHLMGQDIRNKTLGLVGYGRIARATAACAQRAFGMRVCYYSRRQVVPVEGEQAEYVASLDELVVRADVLSLHCPGGPDTHHLIDARRLALMKPTALLINTARGSVVDEDALAQALATRKIAAAGLDVYACEPTVHRDLLSLANVVLLPHLGSATAETRIAMGMRAAANLERFFFGDTASLDRVA